MKEVLASVATLGRVVQAPSLYKKIANKEPVTPTVLSIMALDQLDGMVFRRLNTDGRQRRIADTIADSAIMVTGLTATVVKNPKTRPYAMALVARGAFVGVGTALHLAKGGDYLKGDLGHKLAPASIAASAIAANSENNAVFHSLAIASVGLNSVLAYDYWKGWREEDYTSPITDNTASLPSFGIVRDIAEFAAAKLENFSAQSSQPD